MDTKELELFLALADTLHFGRCSAAMFVSPSTLSRTISQLEEKLGTALFYRDNRSVTLTPSGQRFIPYARATLEQWAQVRQNLQSSDGPLQGELSVYCSVTASYSFVYDLLHQFRQQHPAVAIKLHTGDPEDGLKHVQSAQEDVALVARPRRLPDDIGFISIGSTPLVFIAPKHLALTKQLGSRTGNSKKNPAALNKTNKQYWAELPMILPETGVARSLIDQWLSKTGVVPHIYAQAAGNEAIVSMVSLGFGLGIVPKIVLENSVLADRVETLIPEPNPGTYEVGLVAQKKRLKYPVLSAFWAAGCSMQS